MSKVNARKLLLDPIVDNNPVILQMLGICSALAVTTSVQVSFVMALSVIFVGSFSSLFISIIRDIIPSSVRIIIQMTLIASMVIIVDQFLRAFLPEISRQLSVFVGLIITNCIILGRIEAYAMSNPPLPSFIDGLGNALGYSVLLLIIATARELFGAGTWFGLEILPTVRDGGWYVPNGFMLLSPSAFFLIGLIIWAVRSWKREQVEVVEFKILPNMPFQHIKH